MKHCCNIMTVKVDEGQVVFAESCYWMIPAHGIRKNPMPTTWRYCPYCGKGTKKVVSLLDEIPGEWDER